MKLKFKISENSISSKKIDFIEVYTTRPDTIFGASFVAIAPDHPLSKGLANNNKIDWVKGYSDPTPYEKYKKDMNQALAKYLHPE